ncbi:hypothetical protein BDV12DRAFT_164642 [Aspergillus spectabilis]
MPPSSLPDANLMFLYLCMTESNLTKIDFKAVGAAMGLKVPAAQMRYSRLKKLIESGIVKDQCGEGLEGGEDSAAVGSSAAAGAVSETGETAEEGEAMSAATPSPTKKRKVTKAKKADSSPKKAKGKGRGKGKTEEDGDRDDEREGGGVVKEEMDYC